MEKYTKKKKVADEGEKSMKEKRFQTQAGTSH